MKRKNARQRSAGFTLVELMVVIAIIGLLTAVVGAAFMKRIGRGKQAAAQAQIQAFADALEMYYADVYDYPGSLDGLVRAEGSTDGWSGPYLKKQEIPKDPWGNAYIYTKGGAEGADYTIVSYGKDASPGGEGENQDIAN
ncbi:MAG TPA: type II secretion system major pseudopilin GspG [bacterium]|nr:type II secretion system major pseudopilin GspG [bacterium]HPQ66591.1 type II secretion system major pseudopilin GspG [bacterium]